MELQTRYVTSADGTRIAMSTLGQGRPFVIVQEIWLTAMESYWVVPEIRENLERLAQRRTVVRFDHRGIGLSEREVSDISLDARVSDLVAVIDYCGAGDIDLLGTISGGPVAIAYAARNQTTVRRLILLDALARARDIQRESHTRALWPLIESEWDLFVRTQTLLAAGWTQTGLDLAEANIANSTPQSFLAASRATGQHDVTNVLPDVGSPTLVMHHRRSPWVSLAVVKRLAASLPNARFVQFDQQYSIPLSGEAAIQIIEQFLDEDESKPQDGRSPQGHAVILFADIADSTALTERLGDTTFRDKARELEALLTRTPG